MAHCHFRHKVRYTDPLSQSEETSQPPRFEASHCSLPHLSFKGGKEQGSDNELEAKKKRRKEGREERCEGGKRTPHTISSLK